MPTFQFTTNLKCGGCVAAVKNPLDDLEPAISWHVDLDSPERILTVSTSAKSAEEVIAVIEKAGFKAVLRG